MNRYFISYSHTGLLPGQSGFGNAEVTLAKPIRSMSDVREARAAIQRGMPPGVNIVILNFAKFDQ